MIEHILRYTLPAAYSLLPPRFLDPKASALLLAIGLQESGFLARRQRDEGPARGFWQFERAGVVGVSRHPHTRLELQDVLEQLRYAHLVEDARAAHLAIEHNDVLACVVARLLLWTVPAPLPARDQPAAAWTQYLEGWRPGRPRHETWDAFYEEAWTRVEVTEG